jgi:hypothetical protein
MGDRAEEDIFKISHPISATKIIKKNKGSKNYKYENNIIRNNEDLNFMYISSINQNYQH